MASTSACSWLNRGQLLGLDQVRDGAVEAPLGRQLDMTAVIQDLHTGPPQRLGQAAQGQPDV